MGKQIAQCGKIVNYTGIHYDEDYKTLRELWDEISGIDDWKILKDKYQPILNTKMSEFRILAPKV